MATPEPAPLPESERKQLKFLAGLSLVAALLAGGLFLWTASAIQAERAAPAATQPR
jgi:hypothetical protein